ncbi:glycoside hydrolase family 32 protein [Anoxybacteroides tepidamans]|uniref:glycoside hydrolase family 32 protein n=1 Tax=Anoxybacteroides tepidamans TaxID=265948 RepID=UPI0006862D0C|nr:glycoside hydrolase family 32 protein [Anoxybacillus tepidamans]
MAEKTIKNHAYRLAYHIMAPVNWMNDPNGLVQFNGEYHVFYQFHPDAPKWGPMHWGHVKSKDLVHWERAPIALAPSEEYDQGGCFSGSAVVDDNGILTLIYTGNVWLNQEQTELKQYQCIATSQDGIHFEKDPNNPVLSEPPFDCQGHIRDPKVWKHEEEWYMVLGTREGNIGKVVLYKSKDLRHWTFVNVVAESDGRLGYMWECPDLFHLDGKDVLLFSPQGIEPDGDRFNNLHQTGYVVGTFDYSTGVLKHGAFQELDKGFDFYAAQTFLDEKGRRILFGWMDMWESHMPTQEHGWAGALTIPRLLELTSDDKMVMKPVPELQLLREGHTRLESISVKPEQAQYIPSIKGDRLEIIAEFSLEEFKGTAFGMKVRCSGDGEEETVFCYDVKESVIIFDRNRSGKGEGGVRRAKLDLKSRHTIKFHVFIDRSSVELFVNDGELVMTGRIYPTEPSELVGVFADGAEATVLSMDAWILKDIWQ